MARELEFYLTGRGESPVEEFLARLAPKARTKCLTYLALLTEHGNTLPANYIKHIQGDLWELRPEFGGTEYRFFYVLLTAETVVVLHAFTKKTQRTPSAEIVRALSRLAEVQAQEQARKTEEQREKTNGDT